MRLQQREIEIQMLSQIHRKQVEDLKKQVQEFRDIVMKKNLLITEKELLYKNFRFNTFIASIVALSIFMCLFILWV